MVPPVLLGVVADRVFEEVHDLGVERPSVLVGASGEKCVELGWQAEGDANRRIHGGMLVVK
jgi:hypothetical protein